jgi:phage terminase large subunit-like protein
LLLDLMSLPPAERHARVDALGEDLAAFALHDWEVWGRPNQQPPPGAWRVWLILAGRGYGKTRTGAEWVRQQARRYPLVNVIGPTADDARDAMIEGESGILAICPDDERPEYLVSKRRLEWPNGARTLIFTADEPDRLRGKQHMKLWCDEVAAWRYPEAWDMAMFGLRLGDNPQAVATTTPRPIALVRDLIARDGRDVVVTRGSSYENRENLAPAFFADIIRKYEGTRLGRQELNAEILDDVPGALWTRDRIRLAGALPDMRRVVVGVDPAGTSDEGADETGIVVAGVGVDGHGYVLDDVSARLSPDGWARRAVAAYDRWEADRIVAETNYGGDMVLATIRTVRPRVSLRKVHASRGKAIRAEPIVALYEQGRVFHAGVFPTLEDQLCSWTPDAGPSPDRLDALVWAMTELFRPQGEPGMAFDAQGRRIA